MDFPKTLQRLILNDCNITVPEAGKSIFAGIETHLTDLEVSFYGFILNIFIKFEYL